MKRNMQSTKSKNSSSILESASKSASKHHGQEQLDTDTRLRFRSVLSDPLGVPLLCQLHGKDPSKLPHLGKTSVFLSDDHDHESRSPHVYNISSYDNILEKACNKWIEIDGFPEKNAEPALTSLLVEQIDEIMKDECTVGHGHQQHIPIPANDDSPKGQMDIYFEDSDDVALAVVEVGLDCQDWWANLDQILNYVEMMVINKGITCEKSVLLAVLTLDFDCKNKNKQAKATAEVTNAKLGVFLCNRLGRRNFDMSLLWHSDAKDLTNASKMFGRFLRGTVDFKKWRNEDVPQGYEYYSSNCCRVAEDWVFRVYDSRFGETELSGEIYSSEACNEITGGCTNVVEIYYGIGNGSENPPFWSKTPFEFTKSDDSKQDLRVISVPYRHGTHTVKNWTGFIPIIDQLALLHNEGFVHGDIRAFNTVFVDEKEGWLIDFDFGGKLTSSPPPTYPKGYKNHLTDGRRNGIDEKPILKCDDWYALLILIFEIHTVELRDDVDVESMVLVYDNAKFTQKWLDLFRARDDNSLDTELQPFLDKLKKNLKELDRKVFPVGQNRYSIIDVEKKNCTHNGATGSLLKKN